MHVRFGTYLIHIVDTRGGGQNMLVLQVIAILVVGVGIPYGVYRLLKVFNERCRSLFGYSALTVPKVLIMALASALAYVGYAWSGAAERLGLGGGDSLNSTVLWALGGAIMLGLAYQNYRRTNLLFGTAATLVHVGFAPLALQFGVVLALCALVVVVLAALPRPVYVINAG